jgi:hypothetical protein
MMIHLPLHEVSAHCVGFMHAITCFITFLISYMCLHALFNFTDPYGPHGPRPIGGRSGGSARWVGR